MKILTVILTIYNPKEIELDNYFYSFSFINNFYKSKNNPFEFLIISDNPELPNDVEEKIINFISKNQNIKYIKAEDNLVRLGSVFKHKDKINGKFIKTADPDDFLDPESSIEFVENYLKNIESDSLVINSYKTINKQINEENYNSLKCKTFFWSKSFNPNSTYPTSIFKQIDWNFKLLIWSDDLLGFLLLKYGARIKYAPKHKFYINYRNNGVSVTKNSHTNENYYNDSISFLEKAIDNFENKKDNKLFNKITSKPNLWMYKQIRNDLKLNSLLSKEQKQEKLDFIYKLMRKIKFNFNIWFNHKLLKKKWD